MIKFQLKPLVIMLCLMLGINVYPAKAEDFDIALKAVHSYPIQFFEPGSFDHGVALYDHVITTFPKHPQILEVKYEFFDLLRGAKIFNADGVPYLSRADKLIREVVAGTKPDTDLGFKSRIRLVFFQVDDIRGHEFRDFDLAHKCLDELAPTLDKKSVGRAKLVRMQSRLLWGEDQSKEALVNLVEYFRESYTWPEATWSEMKAKSPTQYEEFQQAFVELNDEAVYVILTGNKDDLAEVLRNAPPGFLFHPRIQHAMNTLVKNTLASTTKAGPNLDQMKSNELLNPIMEGLKARSKALENLRIETITKVTLNEYQNGSVGKVLHTIQSDEFLTIKMGDSYKVINRRFNKEEKSPSWTGVTAFDSALGQTKSFSISDKAKFANAIIDTRDPNTVQYNRYAYFLAGAVAHSDPIPTPSHLAFFLEHPEDMKVLLDKEHGEKLVELTLPDRYDYPEKPAGTRTMLVDPEKDWMPVRVTQSDGNEHATPPETWYVKDSRVVTLAQFDGVLIPGSMRETTRSGADETPNTIMVYDTHILKVEIGKVTQKDLEIVFPPNAIVFDKTKKITYTVPGDTAAQVGGETVAPATLPASATQNAETKRAQSNVRE